MKKPLPYLPKPIMGLIIIAFFVSCNPVKNDITGHYESKEFWEIYYVLASPFYRFVIGNKLDVNSDSTFLHETCGNVSRGKWCIVANQLILKPDSNIGKKIKTHFSTEAFTYEIESNGDLKRFIYIDETKKNHLDYLIKTEVK